MNMPDQDVRPILSQGVRYRWDPLREQHQLLFPEGMMVLNETGAAIIRLCDGRSYAEILQALSQEYFGKSSGEEVMDFFGRLKSRGLIRRDNS